MNCKSVVSLAMVVVMSTWNFAFAQGNSGKDRGRNDDRRSERRDVGPPGHSNRDFGRSHNEHRAKGRGAGPSFEYYPGDRYPYEYRTSHYVVNDWRAHRLTPPPRGYHWVQYGNDYVLVAIATGIILQLLLDR